MCKGDSRGSTGRLHAAWAHHVLYNQACGPGLNSHSRDGKLRQSCPEGKAGGLQAQGALATPEHDFQALLLPEDCLAGQPLLCLQASRGAGRTRGQRLDGVVEKVDGVGLQEVAEAVVQLPEAALAVRHALPGLPVCRDVPQVLCTTASRSGEQSIQYASVLSHQFSPNN